jgi:hypothetical protein
VVSGHRLTIDNIRSFCRTLPNVTEDIKVGSRFVLETSAGAEKARAEGPGAGDDGAACEHDVEGRGGRTNPFALRACLRNANTLL